MAHRAKGHLSKLGDELCKYIQSLTDHVDIGCDVYMGKLHFLAEACEDYNHICDFIENYCDHHDGTLYHIEGSVRHDMASTGMGLRKA